MSMMIVTFTVMLLVVTVMAVGVLLGRKPIQGSCGGMSALGMETSCDVCRGDQTICDEENERVASEQTSVNLSYDASKK